jgi:stage II sporulation protein AB (anti-sigma F factor)
MSYAQTQGIERRDVDDFVAAIGEAFANAIEHAHTREPIEISAWLLDEDHLFASVRDHGVGFAPAEQALPEGYAERGRGLPIMRRCADVLRVHSAPGRGTRVTLGRYVRRVAARTSNTVAG